MQAAAPADANPPEALSIVGDGGTRARDQIQADHQIWTRAIPRAVAR
jgi:hypothetical protein